MAELSLQLYYDPDHEDLQRFHRFIRDNIQQCYDPESCAAEGSVGFIPDSALEDYFSDQDNGRLANLLKAVFPRNELPFPPVAIPTVRNSFKKVFSILLRIGKGHFIQSFVRADGLDDNRLPFRNPKHPPDEFPIDILDSNFFLSFFLEQWSFCAPRLENERFKQWPSERIIPFIRKERIGRSGFVLTYKVEVHPEYNRLCGRTLPKEPSRNTFILKTFNVKAGSPTELEAFTSVRATFSGKNEPNIIRFFGSYTQKNTFNVILEYANMGNLEDYFNKVTPPSTATDINNFWNSILPLARALRGIHELVYKDKAFPKWYQGVNPKNILVCSSEGKSIYECEFKLADLGLQHFSPRIADTNQNWGRQIASAYDAPEFSRRDEWAQQMWQYMMPKANVWSLGCVLSEAAIWSIDGMAGPEGLQTYRQRRAEEAEAHGLGNMGPCFHNGEATLRCVATTHEKLSSNWRQHTLITAQVLGLITIMLVSSQDRLDAASVELRCGKLLNALADKELHNQNERYTARSSVSSSQQSPHHTTLQIRGPELSGGLPQLKNDSSNPSHPISQLSASLTMPPSATHTGHSPSHTRTYSTDSRLPSAPAPAVGIIYPLFHRGSANLPQRESSFSADHVVSPVSEIGSGESPTAQWRISHNMRHPISIRDQSLSREYSGSSNRFYNYSPSSPGSGIRHSTSIGSKSSSNYTDPELRGQQRFHSFHEQQQSPIATHHDQHGLISRPYSTNRVSVIGIEESGRRDSSYYDQPRNPTPNLPFSPNDRASYYEPPPTSPLSVPNINKLPPGLGNTRQFELPKISYTEASSWREHRRGGKNSHIQLLNEEHRNFLKGRDHVFIVDDSSSMREHWNDVLCLLDLLAYILKECDPDGIDLLFSISDRRYNKKNATGLKEVAGFQRPPESRKGAPQRLSNLPYRLSTVFEEYKNSLAKQASRRQSVHRSFLTRSLSTRDAPLRKLSVYVLTDGVWKPKADAVAPIMSLIGALDEAGKERDQVGIQFIQFGADQTGQLQLQYLDRLNKELNLSRDIIDTEPYLHGDILKMLLGAIDPWFDDDPDTTAGAPTPAPFIAELAS